MCCSWYDDSLQFVWSRGWVPLSPGPSLSFNSSSWQRALASAGCPHCQFQRQQALHGFQSIWQSSSWFFFFPTAHASFLPDCLPHKSQTDVQGCQIYTVLTLDPEKAMSTHSSTLAWKIPWTEEPGGLQSTGSLPVGHDWATSLAFFTFTLWRRQWQPIPVFLPAESQGRGSLVGCRLWGRTESDTTEVI